MSPGPAENREIGNRNVAADEFSFAELPIKHAIEPSRLLRVPLETISTVLLVGDLEKMVHLAGHRAEAAHLPHQPLQHRHLSAQIRRPKLTGLLAEINQDRARFEDADRRAPRALGVNDRRDLAIWTDFNEGGGKLLALA